MSKSIHFFRWVIFFWSRTINNNTTSKFAPKLFNLFFFLNCKNLHQNSRSILLSWVLPTHEWLWAHMAKIAPGFLPIIKFLQYTQNKVAIKIHWIGRQWWLRNLFRWESNRFEQFYLKLALSLVQHILSRSVTYPARHCSRNDFGRRQLRAFPRHTASSARFPQLEAANSKPIHEIKLHLRCGRTAARFRADCEFYCNLLPK